VTRTQAIAVALGVPAIFVVALVAGIGMGAEPTLQKQAPLSDLGVGALVGALIGALTAHLLREQAERRRAHKERDGLLRLISAETTYNAALIRQLKEHWDKFMGGPLSGATELPSDNVWSSTRVRLAQLPLSTEDLRSLIRYYATLSFLMGLLRHASDSDADSLGRQAAEIHLPTLFASMEAAQRDVSTVLGKYVEALNVDRAIA
jgi:hypothetical protein